MRIRSWNWGGAQRGPADAGLLDDPLGGEFHAEVAEQRPVDGADLRDLVRADDGDEYDVPCVFGRADQRAGLLLVALAAACAVHDDLGASHGDLDALTGAEVTGRVADAFGGFPGMAAKDGDAGAGVAQPLRHGPPERTGTAGDQDRCCHDVSRHR
jgi:hypothetical protein